MDSPSRAKSKQFKILLGGIFGFVGLLVFGMWISDPNKNKPTPLEVQREKAQEVVKDFTARSSSSVSAEESWIALSEKTLEDLRLQNKQLQNSLEDAVQKIQKLSDDSIATKNRPMPPAPAPSTANGSPAMGSTTPPVANFINSALPPAPRATGNGNAANKDGSPINTIQVINLSKNTGGKEKNKNVDEYLPAGAFATVVLLSGMDAPTGGSAVSNPIPVLMRVMDAGQLPNFWNSGIDNCHITGAAHGEISSERAMIRLEILSCVLLNGDVVEKAVKGYVAGEDGKAGFRGTLVSKQGAMIARSLLAGLASGVGESIGTQYQNVSTSALGSITSVDPNKAVQNGLATGASNALEKVADFYIARANELYPIIEVDANRIGEVILLGGTDLGLELIGNTREGGE